MHSSALCIVLYGTMKILYAVQIMRPALDSHNSISSRNLSLNNIILNPKHAILEEFSQNHGHGMPKLSILDIDPLQLRHKIGNFRISPYTDTPPPPSWCTTTILTYGCLY